MLTYQSCFADRQTDHVKQDIDLLVIGFEPFIDTSLMLIVPQFSSCCCPSSIPENIIRRRST